MRGDRAATVTKKSLNRRDVRRMERGARKATRRRVRPVRGAAVLVAAGALVAGITVPAVAMTQELPTEQEAGSAAAANAQSLVVASEASAPGLAGSSYAATTPQEIQEKKEAEAAAAAAAAAAAEAARQQEEEQQRQNQNNSDNGGGGGGAPAGAGPSNVAPIAAAGQVIFPLADGLASAGWDPAQVFGAPRPGRIHEGTDFFPGGGTPIYAIADGCVTDASFSGGFGNSVELESNIGGSVITSRYAHMAQAPAVGAGQCITAGTYLGPVGNTGNSFGEHLHFELRVNGSLVSPVDWLSANAH